MVGYLKRRLRDESGASITMALLLFLVCAVVASIVLVAGTAAAGRIADLEKMDQTYYSVTSAVELVNKELKTNNDANHCLDITETVVYTETETTDANGVIEYKYAVSSHQIAPSAPASESLSTRLARLFVYGNVKGPDADAPATGSLGSATQPISFDKFTAWESAPPVQGGPGTDTLSLEVPVGGGTTITTNMTVVFKDDGTARVEFSAPSADSNYVSYKVVGTLVPDFDVSTSVAGPNAANAYTETKTTAMSWELTNISTERVVLS